MAAYKRQKTESLIMFTELHVNSHVHIIVMTSISYVHIITNFDSRLKNKQTKNESETRMIAF